MEANDYFNSPAGFDQLTGDIGVWGSTRSRYVEIITTDTGEEGIQDRIIRLTLAGARELGISLIEAARAVEKTYRDDSQAL
jgi:hypothetical protein